MLKGYEVSGIIFQSERSTVMRAYMKDGRRQVLLKTTTSKTPSTIEISRLEHEFSLLSRVISDQVVRPLGFHTAEGGRPVLVMQDIGGRDLMQGLAGGERLSVDALIELAIKIAQGIAAIHAAGIIHKDISPSNIVLNPASGELNIIDFSIATILAKESGEIKTGPYPEGSPAYGSPEQTGWMNRSLDYRSDYYSFGATLFTLAAAEPMFKEHDIAGYFAAHVARKVPRLDEVMARIPPFFADIVAVLTQKLPEDRYQSSSGILLDLKHGLSLLQEKSSITRFALRTRDASERFFIPQKLFGREAQCAHLFNKVDAISRGGKSILLVRGPAGVGKSALIQEVYRKVSGQRGYFIRGKFDQFARNIPFSALCDALNGAIDAVMRLSKEDFQNFQGELKTRLGENVELIVRLLPRLLPIIRESEQGEAEPPREGKARNLNTLVDFIGLFAHPQHPLVMFLDDMQWADPSTMACIEALFKNDNISGLLLVLSYRDDEVAEHHPLRLSLAEIGRSTLVDCIDLDLLMFRDVIQMVAETLGCDGRTAEPLARILYAQTAGSPFFITEALRELHRQKIISFDQSLQRFHWDLGRARLVGASANIVDFLLEKMKTLKPQTAEALKMASVLGGRFSLAMLSLILEKPPGAVACALAEAVAEDLIVPLGDNYQIFAKLIAESLPLCREFDTGFKFHHDHVQHAAYALHNEDERRHQHLVVARLLLANQKGLGIDSIEIARHYKEAITEFSAHEEKLAVIRLGLSAARSARSAGAPKPAETFVEMVIQLLPADAWQRYPELIYETKFLAAEIAFQLNNIAGGEKLITEILDHTVEERRRIEVMTEKGLFQNAAGQYHQTIDTMLDALRLAGYPLPAKPGFRHIAGELARAFFFLRGRDPADLVAINKMRKFEHLNAISNLIILGQAAYITGFQSLFALSFLKTVTLTLRHGLSEEAGYVFGAFAIALTCRLKMFDLAYKFRLLGSELNRQVTDFQLKAVTAMSSSCIGWVWHYDHRGQKHAMEEALHLGHLAGNAFTLGAVAICYPYSLLDADVLEMQSANDKMIHILEEINITSFLQIAQAQRLRYANLLGETASAFSYSVPGTRERDVRRKALAEGNLAFYAGFCALKAETMVLKEKWRAAQQYACVAGRCRAAIFGTRYELMLIFNEILALCRVVRGERGARRLYHRLKIALRARFLRGLYRHNPESFHYMVTLVDAEVSALSGKDPLATLQKFEAAVEASKSYARTQIGLAYHRAALFARDQRMERIAGQYIAEAIFYYEQCKMFGVAQVLKKNYGLLQPGESPGNAILSNLSVPQKSEAAYVPSISTADLDVETLFRMCQLVSQEIKLEKLNVVLLEQLMENTGATRALVLLCESNGSLEVHAEIDRNQPDVFVGRKQGQRVSLPESVLSYVTRAQKTVLIEDLKTSQEFVLDSYLREGMTKSLLAVPIQHHGRLIGVLYLENSQTSQFFSADRCRMVELLVGQLAYAIEHAKVYQNLEKVVAQRSEEIKAVLSSVELGIMIVFGPRLLIHPEYSTHLETVLHRENIMHKSVMEVLFAATDLSAQQNAALVQALQALIGSKGDGFAAALADLPRSVTYRHKEGESLFELQWGLIRDNADVVESLLLSVRDVTSLRKMQGDLARKRRELELVHQAVRTIGVNPEQQELTRLANLRKNLMDVRRGRGPSPDALLQMMIRQLLPGLREALEHEIAALGDLARLLEKPVPTVFFGGDEFYYPERLRRILGEVLLHLFRNSLDHGIELPAERQKLGKAPSGSIRITTSTQGEQFRIRYDDDGRGIDLAKMRRQGISRGLLGEEEAGDPARVAGLVFKDGFSTKDQVSAVSGRGMGMSAIRDGLLQVDGRVEIVLGEALGDGRHAIAFSLIMPLTAVVQEVTQHLRLVS